VLRNRPIAGAVGGAACIAGSGVLTTLAATTPGTVAIFRCLYALPFLAVFVVLERRYGRRPLRQRMFAAAAGVLFAIDLVAWHHAIEYVGAGIATVLGNLQVIFVGFTAWVVLGERPNRRLVMAVPIVFAGVVGVSGIIGGGAYGSRPLVGVVYGIITSISYAGFLLLLRQGSTNLKQPVGPLFDATAVAAVVAVPLGAAMGGIDLVPSWPSHGWLLALALSSQVAGWILISRSLPRLPAVLTSLVLLLQPLATVGLAALVLRENPSLVQLLGCAVILGGILFATRAPARAEGADGQELVEDQRELGVEVDDLALASSRDSAVGA
jgi:drug/metabolite transporter (DMT)-like permease